MKRILVYRAGTLGDAIVAVPAIQALRRSYPHARLALMSVAGGPGRIGAGDIFEEFGWFDTVITYTAAELRRPASLLALHRRVARFGADLVVYLSNDRNSALRILRDRLFFLLAGTIHFVGGASTGVTWYGRMKRDDAEYPFEVDRLRAVARQAGADDQGPAIFDLPAADAARARVDRLLTAHGFDATTPLIALCPGSAQAAKRWPVERYDEVARRLMTQHGAAIVVVGGPDEARIGAELGTRWPEGRWWNAAAQLSMLELAELLRRCRLFVGNDTGPMHLAAAVGTRCLAVFSAQCPERRWHPYGSDHAVIRTKPACRHCFLADCRDHASACLTAISVDDVWRAYEGMAACR